MNNPGKPWKFTRLLWESIAWNTILNTYASQNLLAPHVSRLVFQVFFLSKFHDLGRLHLMCPYVVHLQSFTPRKSQSEGNVKIVSHWYSNIYIYIMIYIYIYYIYMYYINTYTLVYIYIYVHRIVHQLKKTLNNSVQIHTSTAFHVFSLTWKHQAQTSSTSNIGGFHHLDNRCLSNSFDGSTFSWSPSSFFGWKLFQKWVFPKIGVPPKWVVYNGKPY